MSHNSNNNLKLELLSNGIFHIYRRYRYLQFLYYSNEPINVRYRIQIEKDLDYFYTLLEQIGDDIKKQCERIFNAHRKKSQRLKKRIEKILEKPSVFITYTFTDETLENTCAKTRRVYISRELKSLNVPYIANIDYGKINEREHYHAIAQIDWIDRELYDLGTIYVEKISTKNSTALAKYINKLTNHALKETTGSDRLIYSR